MPDGMPYVAFLDAVIDDGLDEVRRTYLRPDQALKREGAIDGLNACRGLTAEALLVLRDAAAADVDRHRRERDPRYWYWRLREAQIEWVLNVVNAASYANGLPMNFPPTAQGMRKAIDVLGLSAA